MTRRVYRDTDGATLNESEFCVLAEVARHAPNGGAVAIRHADLRESVGICPEQLRRVTRSLADRGLILKTTRFAEDGGQRSNLYELTDAGKTILARALDAERRRGAYRVHTFQKSGAPPG